MISSRTPIFRFVVVMLAAVSFVLLLLPSRGFAQTPSQAAAISKKQPLEIILKQYLGIPYRKGGISKKGMDCSGFVRTVYRQLFGLELPHSSRDQYHCPDLAKITRNRLQTGDLLFFARKKKINHVGIYLANNKFIHASSSLGITISSLDEAYWQKRFFGSKRPPNPVTPTLLSSPAREDFASGHLPLADDGIKG